MGSPFTVLTDNNPLAHLKTAKLGACEMRWAAQLAAFTFDVKFRSGISNRCADALSRYPGHCSVEKVDRVMQSKTHSSPIASQVRGCCSVNFTVTDEPPVCSGLSGVLPSWSPVQLTALQNTDSVVGVIWKRWEQRWTPW